VFWVIVSFSGITNQHGLFGYRDRRGCSWPRCLPQSLDLGHAFVDGPNVVGTDNDETALVKAACAAGAVTLVAVATAHDGFSAVWREGLERVGHEIKRFLCQGKIDLAKLRCHVEDFLARHSNSLTQSARSMMPGDGRVTAPILPCPFPTTNMAWRGKA
jgi:hypothetical protein